MKNNLDIKIAFTIMGLLIMLVGFFQSWGVALSILNLCLISSVMSMGVNMQWGYSGLINFGVMGFLAIGGLAVIVISVPPVYAAWDAGGTGIIMSGLLLAALVYAVFYVHSKVTSKYKNYIIFVLVISIVPIMKVVSGPSIHAIESIDAATSGYLGGFNMPIIFSWFVGALLAAFVAFVTGKVCLGLRSDYLAIATLLISGIVITIVKHEEWLTRGVKNVIGLKRPAPYEVDLQNSDWFIGMIGDSLTDAFGSELNGSFGSMPGSTSPGALKFAEYAEANGVNPSVYVGESYDAAALIVLAMASADCDISGCAGSDDSASIADNILSVANGPGVKIYAGELAKGIRLTKLRLVYWYD